MKWLLIILCVALLSVGAWAFDGWIGGWAGQPLGGGLPPVLPIAFTIRDTGTSTANTSTLGGSYATAAMNSLSTNALLLACVVNSGTVAQGATVIPTFAGAGLGAWTMIATTNAPTVRATLFYNSGTPTLGSTASAAFGNSGFVITGCAIVIGEYRYAATNGTAGSGAIIQSLSKTNTTQNPLITLTNIWASGSNAVCGCFGKPTSAYGGTVDANWVEDYDAGWANPTMGVYVQHRLATTQAAVSNTTAGAANWAGVAVEIGQGDLTQ